MNRVKAFIKRLIQICAYQDPNFVCGALYLVSQIFSAKPGALNIMLRAEDEDEEEHFVDKDKEEIKADKDKEEIKAEDDKESKKEEYDPNKRDPLYANAQKSSLYELNLLLQHYHPSVVKFAQHILDGKPIEYTGDPLEDFTQSAFLEKFVYKNPKKKQEKFKSHSKKTTLIPKQPMNSQQFLDRDEEDIPETERFFYKFFKMRERLGTKKSKKKKDLDEEDPGDALVSDGDDDEGAPIPSTKADEEEEEGSEDDIDLAAFGDSDEDLENFDPNSIVFGEDDLSDEEENTGLKSSRGSSFAPAEDFAEMLETSGDTYSGVSSKQLSWEDRGEKKSFGKRKGKNFKNAATKKQKKK